LENKVFEYNSADYRDFIRLFGSSDKPKAHALYLFAGVNDTNRKCAIDEVCREVLSEPVDKSLADIISKDEGETRANIDALISEVNPNAEVLILRDGEQLCGVYTGYTYSVVKYATPQERYFLKKIKDLPLPVIVEFRNEDHLDETIEREADAIVKFNPPQSFFDRIFWRLSQIHVNGSILPSNRPA